MCLTNDYSLIDDLHIFVYGRAECGFISLECTKVKFLISNNFWFLLAESEASFEIGQLQKKIKTE